ncbi:MAG TPA: ABC transporter substrate-binding protein [Alphaproteobacteria bacterium]|nr:ABC transporter substrate-binding protein [Alphaproteobacteria bacterium]
MLNNQRTLIFAAWALAAAFLPASAGPAAAAESISIALPGVPPIAATTIFYVAKDEGFFKKFHANVQLRPFDNGTAAAQAVVAGSLDLALGPTPGIVRMVSNADVPLIAIWGMAHPDWLLGSGDPKLDKCIDLKGQAVGVDAIGGARSVTLGAFLRTCGLKLSDVKQVALSSNAPAAMVAGQIKFAPLHLDEVPAISEQMGHPVTIIATYSQISPVSHYLLLVSRKDHLAKKREQYVRMLAGLIDAARFMNDPKNADKVAKIATVTGRPAADFKKALPEFLKIEYWPLNNDGLEQKNVEAAIKIQEKVGGIKPGKTAVAYGALVDRSVWKDAAKLAK